MRVALYPLALLGDLRRRRVDEAARALADAALARERAVDEVRRANAERLAHAAAASRVVAEENAALVEGTLRVVDLARSDAFQARIASEDRALVDAAHRAHASATSAEDDHRSALDNVAHRHAEAQGIKKDFARWTAEQAATAASREEEALSEAWRPRR